jgi:redox-sensitive bicupin YhaK (pirin superfamily)
MPKFTGVKPNYQEKFFGPEEKRGQLRLIASQDGRDGSLTVVQDTDIFAGLLDGEERIVKTLAAGRRAYLHVARGSLMFNGLPLVAGDGVKVTDETELTLDGGDKAEVLFFDLP